jgi:hypothetical protein
MKGMRWRWMGWSWARQGLQTKKYSTYFCSVVVFILFVMAFFLFCFYIDIIFCVKECECWSCGSERNGSELCECRRL